MIRKFRPGATGRGGTSGTAGTESAALENAGPMLVAPTTQAAAAESGHGTSQPNVVVRTTP
jgi:hypothetical protein